MGQAAQLRRHEVRDIVGETLGADAWQVPGPGRSAAIECQQRLLRQGEQEVDREERIAGRLLDYQLSQGSRAPMLRMQGIRKQPLHVVRHEGRKADLPHPPPASRIDASIRVSGCAGLTSLSR